VDIDDLRHRLGEIFAEAGLAPPTEEEVARPATAGAREQIERRADLLQRACLPRKPGCIFFDYGPDAPVKVTAKVDGNLGHARVHSCDSSDCPKCFARQRAGHMLWASEVVLYGPRPAGDTEFDARRPPRTGPVYTWVGPVSCRGSLTKRISRAAEALGRDPGYLVLRHAAGSIYVVADVPFAGGRPADAVEAALWLAELLEDAPPPPRREGSRRCAALISYSTVWREPKKPRTEREIATTTRREWPLLVELGEATGVEVGDLGPPRAGGRVVGEGVTIFPRTWSMGDKTRWGQWAEARLVPPGGDIWAPLDHELGADGDIGFDMLPGDGPLEFKVVFRRPPPERVL
jgi:hypothetical protein